MVISCSSTVGWMVGSSPGKVKAKTIKLVFAVFPLRVRSSKTSLLEFGIMYSSGQTYLHVDCCFTELAL